MSRDLLSRGRRALIVLVAALCGVAVGAQAATVTTPSLRELVGQRLVVAMAGTTPSQALLARIRRGEVSGVLLFGGNVDSPSRLRALTSTLHRAARAGGRPRLLVLVDQEGGAIRRLGWAPPALDATALGRTTAASVRTAGRSTGVALRTNGVDVDLAPVADVPRVPGAFIGLQRRAFGTDATRVGALAAAFAGGLADAGILATAKHFPGLGGAIESTDVAAVTVVGGPRQLEADLEPFRRLIEADVPLVMLSNAVHPAYGPEPALWTPAVHRLLRRELGFDGVTISDALEPVARTRGRPLASVAFLAARAGTDLLLLAGGEADTARVHKALVAAAGDGRLSRAGLERSYARVVALKRAG